MPASLGRRPAGKRPDAHPPQIQPVGIPAGANRDIWMVGARDVGLAGNQQQRETRIVEMELVTVQATRERRAARPMLRIMIVVVPAGVVEHRKTTSRHPHSFPQPKPDQCEALAPSVARHKCHSIQAGIAPGLRPAAAPGGLTVRKS